MQTDNAVHGPGFALLLPDGYEPAGIRYRIGLLLVSETMQSQGHGPESFYFMDFQAAFHQRPGYLAADIGADAFQDPGLGGAEPALVVVKLQRIVEQAGLGLQITVVVGAEIGGVE